MSRHLRVNSRKVLKTSRMRRLGLRKIRALEQDQNTTLKSNNWAVPTQSNDWPEVRTVDRAHGLTAPTIIGATDQETANAGDAHFTQGAFSPKVIF